MDNLIDIVKEYQKKEQYSNILAHSVKRLLKGDVITLNYNRKKAYINYYVGTNTEEINWFDAILIIHLSFIDIDSSNIETEEDHYRSSYIIKNENELKSVISILKYKI